MGIQRLFAALFAAALLLAAPVTHAQDADWDIIAISGAGDAHRLLSITPDGIEERATLPADFPAHYGQIALSPDGTLLATIPAQWNRVVITSTDAAECCTEYAFTEDEVFLTSLAGFSPDGTKLALSYVVEEPLRSAMLTLDVATGEVDAFVDTTGLSDTDPNFLTYPVLAEWRGDGVHYVTSCINCVDAAMDNWMSVWDPSTGTENPTTEQYDYRNDRLERVPATLRAVFALDYPSAANAEAIFWGPESFGVRNAIVMPGEQTGDGDAVVYATDKHYSLIPRWAADGDAFLVFFNNDAPGSGELVLSDGSRLPVDHPASQYFAGTPDGWVRRQGNSLTHYRLEDGDLVTTELGDYTGALAVLRAPLLGADGGSTFPTVPPPEPVTCEGFLPSRLLVGHLGRVLPGPANNMREEPSTLSPIVAKIAGSEAFAILEGPVCNQGLAWWRVEFNHREGWTAEGSGQNYWLDMAPDRGYQSSSVSS